MEAISLMNGKVCMVTGSNSGLGKATALGLAKMGASVVMICRDQRRGEEALSSVRTQTGGESVDLMLADLSSQDSIHGLAKEFMDKYQRLDFDVLVGGGVLLPMARAGIDRERSVLELEPRPNLKRAPNGRFQVAEPGSFLGLLLAAPRSRARGAIDGCPRIGAVCTGGPAAAAGLKRGDVLLAIEGRSCAGREVGELNRGLWPSRGKRIRLRVRDAGGRTRELSLP